jgi:hypothetical protein
MLYGVGGFLLIFIWHIVRELQHRADMTRMLNRIMSKNYSEFEYYDKKWKADLSEVEKMRTEERGSREEARSETPEAVTEDVAVDNFIKAYEEDWRPSDINMEEAKKQAKERA